MLKNLASRRSLAIGNIEVDLNVEKHPAWASFTRQRLSPTLTITCSRSTSLTFSTFCCHCSFLHPRLISWLPKFRRERRCEMMRKMKLNRIDLKSFLKIVEPSSHEFDAFCFAWHDEWSTSFSVHVEHLNESLVRGSHRKQGRNIIYCPTNDCSMSHYRSMK